MTFREKLEKENPTRVRKEAWGGVLGCPPNFQLCRIEGVTARDEVCTRCWDHKIPGSDIEDGVTEEMKKQIIEESIVTQKPNGDLELKVERKILDSGNRRQFESGAVRDIQEGKGRCDLLPLDVLGTYLRTAYDNDNLTNTNHVFELLSYFQESGSMVHLYEVLLFGPFDNVFTMILEVAKHFEEGAKKYGENNWQKGIPVHCYIDSAGRHYLKFLRGDKDEPHDRAFCWNIMCAIWTCKHKPELNEYAVKEEK